MIMPVLQRCPKCGTPFMGSDCIGYPCMECEINEYDDMIPTPTERQESEDENDL